MPRTITLADMRNENALVIVANIAGLLKQIDRAAGSTLADGYRAEALSGDYAHLCAVSERYAIEHLQTTLHAQEGDLA